MFESYMEIVIGPHWGLILFIGSFLGVMGLALAAEVRGYDNE